jgi:hypothetical protein
VGKDSVKNIWKGVKGEKLALGAESVQWMDFNDTFLESMWGLVEVFSISFRPHLGDGSLPAKCYRPIFTAENAEVAEILKKFPAGSAASAVKHWRQHPRGKLSNYRMLSKFIIGHSRQVLSSCSGSEA